MSPYNILCAFSSLAGNRSLDLKHVKELYRRYNRLVPYVHKLREERKKERGMYKSQITRLNKHIEERCLKESKQYTKEIDKLRKSETHLRCLVNVFLQVRYTLPYVRTSVHLWMYEYTGTCTCM